MNNDEPDRVDWPSLALVRALEHGERANALRFWREIAEGRIEGDALAFVRDVAARLVEAGELKSNDRDRAREVMAAVGLGGRNDDEYRELRSWLLDGDWDDCRPLIDRESQPRLIERAIAEGKAAVKPGETPEAVRERLKAYMTRLRKALKAERDAHPGNTPTPDPFGQ